MQADIESMTQTQKEMLIRLLGLVQIPKETWTPDDHQFFRDIRAAIQRSTNGGANEWSGKLPDK